MSLEHPQKLYSDANLSHIPVDQKTCIYADGVRIKEQLGILGLWRISNGFKFILSDNKHKIETIGIVNVEELLKQIHEDFENAEKDTLSNSKE